ncbi:MAG: DUF433 domain-containing protein [Thaumarchaeota archaeon]|nr:DUF433 domain-containing protein [Nitrososphaerota archaeon]
MKKKTTLLDRIEINPNILAGKPVIKGTRIAVYLILELLSAGYDFRKIINSYPSLTERDIRAAIEYAAVVMKNEELAELDA